MIALTASSLASRLAFAENRKTTNIIAALDEGERQIARSLLSRVSNDARIDPVAFVHDVRQRARDSRSDSRFTPDLIARADAHLARLHVEAAARSIKAGSGELYRLSLEMDRRGAGSGKIDDVEPDYDDDDDGEKPRRSRRVPRYRRAAAEKPAQAARPPSAMGAGATRPMNRVVARDRPPAPMLRGGRCFVGGQDVTPDHDIGFGRPPWLLPDDAEAAA